MDNISNDLIEIVKELHDATVKLTEVVQTLLLCIYMQQSDNDTDDLK